MNVLVILAHTTPGSFNHAIAETVVNTLERLGHSGFFHDLYAEGFDPVLPSDEILGEEVEPVVSEHCEQLTAADGIVIVHPNWWGMPPAILKGWVDRVIRPEVAYRFEEGDSGEGIPVGLLKAKAAIVFNTSNTPEKREQEVFGDPLENLWKTCIFDLCGVKEFHRRNFTVVVTSTEEERKGWLEEVEGLIGRMFPSDQ
jgi:putative NADPH-quinone reductase